MLGEPVFKLEDMSSELLLPQPVEAEYTIDLSSRRARNRDSAKRYRDNRKAELARLKATVGLLVKETAQLRRDLKHALTNQRLFL